MVHERAERRPVLDQLPKLVDSQEITELLTQFDGLVALTSYIGVNSTMGNRVAYKEGRILIAPQGEKFVGASLPNCAITDETNFYVAEAKKAKSRSPYSLRFSFTHNPAKYTRISTINRAAVHPNPERPEQKQSPVEVVLHSGGFHTEGVLVDSENWRINCCLKRPDQHQELDLLFEDGELRHIQIEVRPYQNDPIYEAVFQLYQSMTEYLDSIKSEATPALQSANEGVYLLNLALVVPMLKHRLTMDRFLTLLNWVEEKTPVLGFITNLLENSDHNSKIPVYLPALMEGREYILPTDKSLKLTVGLKWTGNEKQPVVFYDPTPEVSDHYRKRKNVWKKVAIGHLASQQNGLIRLSNTISRMLADHLPNLRMLLVNGLEGVEEIVINWKTKTPEPGN